MNWELDIPSKEVIDKNKELLAKWPFLEQKDYQGKPSYEGEERFYYTMYNYWDDTGWEKLWKKFIEKLGKLWEKLPDNEYKKNFYILDTKEKWGSLRVSLPGYTKEMMSLENAIEAESKYTCYQCGKQPKDSKGNRMIWYSQGWILPFCKKCAAKYFSERKLDNIKLSDWKDYFSRDVHKGKFKIRHYNNDGYTVEELEDL